MHRRRPQLHLFGRALDEQRAGVDVPRQRVGYHLRELERAGLVELVEERRKRNCVERVVRASARAYMLDPALLSAAAGPEAARDRFSWATLVSAASRAIRDLALLRRRADRAGKGLATLTLEAEVAFVIGRPANDGTTRVWYTVLTAGTGLEVEFVPLAYDHEGLAREMEAEKLPPEFVETIRTGWWTTCLENMPARERRRGRY